MTTNITPNCSWCGKHEPSELIVNAVGVYADGGLRLRAVDGYGVAKRGATAADLDDAVNLLGMPLISDDQAAVWADIEDEAMMLQNLGQVWSQAREAERIAAAAVYAAIRHATEQDVPETQIAAALGVDRMTVRRALGKR